MKNVFDTLMERGYIEQCTHEQEIRDLLAKESVTFYIGFDPTADSLHVGHFIQIMVMTHMQRAGHRPIALLGGGTTMVGDPSGKADMRKMLTQEQIADNGEKFKKIFEKFLDFGEGKAIMANNADWLLNLNYVDFLREVGAHFSVNRMIAAECYKSRMETGLTFLEFNYMIMQSYDFLKLAELYDCKMQFGGNDQWSNIISGVDLTRKKLGKSVYGMTFKLLVNSEGKKMGKTEKGALWLDPEKTSPFEFYQYWRNVDDSDVENCLALLTFLPMEQVRELGGRKDESINESKEVLAFEVTKMIHGEEEAVKAQNAARALFGGGGADENMPSSEVELSEVQDGMDVMTLLIKIGLASSKSDARRLIEQGGIQINGQKVDSPATLITEEDFGEGYVIVKKGKKIFHRIVLNL
ncbi:MAG: tyrosine--tRNA ligase [Anaerofustis sp.]